MVDIKQAEAAFTKISNNAPSSALRKAAAKYWSAYSSDAGATEAEGSQFQLAIEGIPVDYRTPAMKCLEAFNSCKEQGDNTSDCYLNLAIELAERVVHG